MRELFRLAGERACDILVNIADIHITYNMKH